VKRNLVTMKFYETYYYANVIHNVLCDPSSYIRHLNSWHEDSAPALFTVPFPRWSILHSLSEYIIRGLLDEHVSDVAADAIAQNPKADLWIDQASSHHGFQTPGFRAWLAEEGIAVEDTTEDHISDYHTELALSGPLEELLEQLTAEVFFVLFGNRTLLERLHRYVSGIVSDMGPGEATASRSEPFAAVGQLRRVHIPSWAKQAVFFRDRGICTRCLVNLSGLLAAQNDENYDHIVPLKRGGTNDVTNLQLLCGDCNKSKGGMNAESSPQYESWY
jgi:hypothetical protein